MTERDSNRPGRPEKALVPEGQEGYTPLGQFVRMLRREKSLSITDLAARAKLGKAGRAYISRLEHGEIQEPGGSHLNSLAEALEVDGGVLLRLCTRSRYLSDDYNNPSAGRV